LQNLLINLTFSIQNSPTIQNHPKCIQETSISTASLESKSSLKDSISSLHIIKEKSTYSKVKQHCSREKSLSNNYEKHKQDNCHIIRHSESQNSESSVIKLKPQVESSSHHSAEHQRNSNCFRNQDSPSTPSSQKNETSNLSKTSRKEDKSGNNFKEYKPQNEDCNLLKYSDSSLLHLKPQSPQQELLAAKQVESEKHCRVVSSSSKNCITAELKTCLSKSTKATESNMGQGDVGSCCAKYILCMFNFVFFVSIKIKN
jgi:hypothetical protein